MRLLHVFDKPDGGGGIRRHVELATEFLRDAGHEAAWLRLGDDVPRSFAPWQASGLHARFEAAIQRAGPDVVLLHAGFTALAAPLVNALARLRPTIGVLHDVAPFCLLGTRRFRDRDVVCQTRRGLECFAHGCVAAMPRELARFWVKAGLWAAWRRLPLLIAPSRYVAELAVAHGADAGRVAIVPHGVPAGERATGSELLFVGTLTEHKGVGLLVEALAELDDIPWRLRVVGTGPASEIFRRLPPERLALCGRLDGAALEEAYARAAVLAYPTRLPESLGLVGLEAMSRGIPVVGFALGGAAEWLLDGKTGIAAEPFSAASLAAALRKILLDPALGSKLGEAGLALHRDQFSPEAWIRRMAPLLEAVAGRARRAA